MCASGPAQVNGQRATAGWQAGPPHPQRQVEQRQQLQLHPCRQRGRAAQQPGHQGGRVEQALRVQPARQAQHVLPAGRGCLARRAAVTRAARRRCCCRCHGRGCGGGRAGPQQRRHRRGCCGGYRGCLLLQVGQHILRTLRAARGQLGTALPAVRPAATCTGLLSNWGASGGMLTSTPPSLSHPCLPCSAAEPPADILVCSFPAQLT